MLLEECCPELSAMTEMFYKASFPSMAAPSFIRLLSTSNMSSATKELNFKFNF